MPGLTEGNFNRNANDLSVGPGVLRSVPLHLPNLTVSGATLTDTNIQTQLLLDNSAEYFLIPWTVPLDYNAGDYDSADSYPSDYLAVVVTAIATTTTTNTIDIDSVYTAKLADANGTMDAVTLNTAIDADLVVSASAVARYKLELYDMGLEPGDVVNIAVGCTIAGNNILVLGAELQYRSVYRAYNEADL